MPNSPKVSIPQDETFRRTPDETLRRAQEALRKPQDETLREFQDEVLRKAQETNEEFQESGEATDASDIIDSYYNDVEQNESEKPVKTQEGSLII